MESTPTTTGLSVLGLDPELLSTCVSCGLCLPHCPTFRVTGEEKYSPRGRIDAMRAVDRGELPIDDAFVDFVETCVQCRGCEPACPSGVQFGALMEETRTALASAGRITPWWQRLGLRALGHHRLLLAGSSALAVAQRLRLVPSRIGAPRLTLRRPASIAPTARSSDADVWLYPGCVMDAWQRDTHRNAAELVTLTGSTFAVAGPTGACCGALHVHAGLHDEAAALAHRVIDSMPGDAPILVDSAGCGAAMKDYGKLLGTHQAQRFSERVLDIDEWIAANLHRVPSAHGPRPVVIVQDPCHLRHVQRAHESVRTLLHHVAEIVELDDDGLCCGAGGAYSFLQPELAGEIRDRKVAAIGRARSRSGATVIASANPGCSMHLAAVVDLPVRHPVDIVAEALGVSGR
jgi:glycolate oxidase iron-sulfur subunit